MLAWLTTTAVCAWFRSRSHVELEPHGEEKEEHADLGEELQQRRRGRREKKAEHAGRDRPEQRRPQHDPRDDLSDHGRLADAPEHHPASRAAHTIMINWRRSSGSGSPSRPRIPEAAGEGAAEFSVARTSADWLAAGARRLPRTRTNPIPAPQTRTEIAYTRRFRRMR